MSKNKPIEMEFGCFGNPVNPTLIIMHGLLGSSRNWLSLGKELAQYYNVFLLDMRNHGNSPHTEAINYDLMVEDLVYWVGSKNIDNFYLMGHSMGGKVAMVYACKFPQRVKGLIIEDIAPIEYPLRYVEEFEAMLELDLATINNRTDADNALAQKIPDSLWRQFLLTNLSRDPNTQKFYWKINLPVLKKHLADFMKNPLTPKDQYQGPVLVIQGALSDFIKKNDYPIFDQHFPKNKVLVVDDAGHNVHIENKNAVLEALRHFV